MHAPLPQGPPALTLLLPQDRHLALGHAVCRVPVPPAGLTCGTLLAHIAAYYAQALDLDESTAALLRAAGGGGARAGAQVPRGSLLGPRLSLEGAVRATRDPVGCVYEVILGL